MFTLAAASSGLVLYSFFQPDNNSHFIGLILLHKYLLCVKLF